MEERKQMNRKKKKWKLVESFVIHSPAFEGNSFEFSVHLIFSIMSVCLCFMSDIKLHGTEFIYGCAENFSVHIKYVLC